MKTEIIVYTENPATEQVNKIMVDNQDLPVKMTWDDARSFIEVLNKGNYKGFSNWRLPTKDELNDIFLLKDNIGGFANYGYWNSTEINAIDAWYQYFYNGNQYNYSKGVSSFVRCVRSINNLTI